MAIFFRGKRPYPANSYLDFRTYSYKLTPFYLIEQNLVVLSLIFARNIDIVFQVIFSAMPVHLIGRESHFHGKSLYEIARNLRRLGEGRYVYRVSFSKRYEEPSFYKLTKVVPDMNAKVYVLLLKGFSYLFFFYKNLILNSNSWRRL